MTALGIVVVALATGAPAVGWVLVGLGALVALLAWWASRLRVVVDAGSIQVAWGRPVAAQADPVGPGAQRERDHGRPDHWGGWGYRWIPWAHSLRGRDPQGTGHRPRPRDGRAFTVTVDDAITGAKAASAALRRRRPGPESHRPRLPSSRPRRTVSAGGDSSAIWTVLSAAPLRRLSLLTNSARPAAVVHARVLPDPADVARVLPGGLQRRRDVGELDAGRGRRAARCARSTDSGRANSALSDSEWPVKTGTRTQVPDDPQVRDAEDLAALVAELLLLVGLERCRRRRPSRPSAAR